MEMESESRWLEDLFRRYLAGGFCAEELACLDRYGYHRRWSGASMLASELAIQKASPHEED